MEEHINQIVEAIRDTERNPDVAGPQLSLINASKEFIQVRRSASLLAGKGYAKQGKENVLFRFVSGIIIP